MHERARCAHPRLFPRSGASGARLRRFSCASAPTSQRLEVDGGAARSTSARRSTRTDPREVDDAPGKSLGRPARGRGTRRRGPRGRHRRRVRPLSRRRGGPAFVERARRAAASRWSRAIRRAGGLAVARASGQDGPRRDHRADSSRRDSPPSKCFIPITTADDRDRYDRLARQLGLVVTGGSDYHGPGSGRSRRPRRGLAAAPAIRASSLARAAPSGR